VAEKRVVLLKYLSGFCWGGHPLRIRTIGLWLIEIKLDYAAPIYINANETNIKTLEVIRNKALRYIGGSTKTTPTHVLSATTEALPWKPELKDLQPN